MSDFDAESVEAKERPKTRGKCCKRGTFMCEQAVLYPLGRNRLIHVDRCLIPELQSLWNLGIETGGCCCGHFEKGGFIQVFPEQSGAMRALGYEEIPPVLVDGELMGEHAFRPKTGLEFRGYAEVRTELEERCQQLERVAKDIYSYARALLYISLREEGPIDEERKQALASSSMAFRDRLTELGVSLDG